MTEPVASIVVGEKPNASVTVPSLRTAILDPEDAASDTPHPKEGHALRIDGPAILAQPPVNDSEGKGSACNPREGARRWKAMPHLPRGGIAHERGAVAGRLHVLSESADAFVHQSPWVTVAVAALGGLLMGMLAAR
jgi:ElaB/YqjD/DUF883 family membrane-anchored ribosome-binding protein